MVSHAVHPFIHVSLLAIAHCRESLVWFEVSGFFCTTNARPSLELLLREGAALLLLSPQGPISHACTVRARSTVLRRHGIVVTLPSVAAGGGQGQFSCPSALSDSSLTSPTPSVAGQGQGEGWGGSVFLEYTFPPFYPKVMSDLDGKVCLLKPTESWILFSNQIY